LSGVVLCILVEVYWHFRSMYWLDRQGQRVVQASNKQEVSTGSGSLRALLFDLDDGGRMFLQNIGKFVQTTWLQIPGDSTLYGSCLEYLRLNV
jgi:hypothetical protein